MEARSNVFPSTGRSAAMAHAFVSQSGIDAAIQNPAGVASLPAVAFAAFYEKRFTISELSSQGIIGALPVGKGVFSACFHTFGPLSWRETEASLGYSLQLSPKLSGGVKINYLSMKLPEENAQLGTASATVGLIYKLLPSLFIGLNIDNPWSVALQTSTFENNIPYKIQLGGHSKISENFTVSAEVEKLDKEPVVLKMGAEWEAANHFFLRGGYSSSTTKLYGGLGFSYRYFTADLAFGLHQTLGVTPFVSIKFNLN
ncbi:MAG TPA: hypothetical protein PKV50_01780 [Prolixibacteraceae bacterium]|nr:hypothetical protein [Prolixibacteraceae bacterium]